MATDIIMPKMGESITEGTITEWKLNFEDTVKKDQNKIYQLIQNDKRLGVKKILSAMLTSGRVPRPSVSFFCFWRCKIGAAQGS